VVRFFSIVLLCIVGAVSYATDYRIAGRSGYPLAVNDGQITTMPMTDWTNCVYWFEASIPPANPGTASYTVPDLSPDNNGRTRSLATKLALHSSLAQMNFI